MKATNKWYEILKVSMYFHPEHDVQVINFQFSNLQDIFNWVDVQSWCTDDSLAAIFRSFVGLFVPQWRARFWTNWLEIWRMYSLDFRNLVNFWCRSVQVETFPLMWHNYNFKGIFTLHNDGEFKFSHSGVIFEITPTMRASNGWRIILNECLPSTWLKSYFSKPRIGQTVFNGLLKNDEVREISMRRPTSNSYNYIPSPFRFK